MSGRPIPRSSSCPSVVSSVHDVVPPSLLKPRSPSSTTVSSTTTLNECLVEHSAAILGPELAPMTSTVMVRNIPTRFTSLSFLRVLDESGFNGTFDFFYLPMDFRTGKNMGYCFINFVSAHFANMFANIFHGTRLGVTTSNKVLHVSSSKRQGLRENVVLFRGSDLLSSFSLPYFKPFVQIWGELVPLCESVFHQIVSFSP